MQNKLWKIYIILNSVCILYNSVPVHVKVPLKFKTYCKNRNVWNQVNHFFNCSIPHKLKVHHSLMKKCVIAIRLLSANWFILLTRLEPWPKQSQHKSTTGGRYILQFKIITHLKWLPWYTCTTDHLSTTITSVSSVSFHEFQSFLSYKSNNQHTCPSISRKHLPSLSQTNFLC